MSYKPRVRVDLPLITSACILLWTVLAFGFSSMGFAQAVRFHCTSLADSLWSCSC